MIKIKLNRDQARGVQETFFPYIEMLCETKVNDARQDPDTYLNALVIRSIFFEVMTMFNKRLLTEGNSFVFKFSEAQGITFYKLLLILPIKGDQIWYINLRQFITDILNNQLQEPLI